MAKRKYAIHYEREYATDEIRKTWSWSDEREWLARVALHQAVDRILDGDDDDLKLSTVFVLFQREAEAVD